MFRHGLPRREREREKEKRERDDDDDDDDDDNDDVLERSVISSEGEGWGVEEPI